MKKLLTLFVVLIIVVSLAGCSTGKTYETNYCKVHFSDETDYYDGTYHLENTQSFGSHTLYVYDVNGNLIHSYSGDFVVECSIKVEVQ